MNKIDILLATYNAESHISALLHSLQDQTFTEWSLIVHDDGSSDKTPAILERFASSDERITVLHDDKRFGSAQGNFMYLLTQSQAPFAIFCDDDDIWLEDKLQVLYENILQRDNTIPQAVWCNSYMYKPQTAEIGGSATLAILSSLRDTLFANCGVQGCAILFNAALRDVCLPAPEVVAMHDHLLTLAALTFGEMTYVPRHLMLYRRHADTVTGYTVGRRSEKVRGFFGAGKGVLDPLHFRAVRCFYEAHCEQMTPETDAVFQKFFAFEGRSRISNAFHVLTDGFSLFGHRSILIAKLLLRPLFPKKKP